MDKSQIKEQLTHINPSVPDAFYRRILREDNLSYLRENMDSIIGFEIDLNESCPLSGYTLIAIKKHSILAYRSDLHEKKKLILFPSIDKLFDSSFELLNLTVTKCLYKSYSFKGIPLEHGKLKDVIDDVTPPITDLDLPQNVSEKMMTTMMKSKELSILEERKNFGSTKVGDIDADIVQMALNTKKSSVDDDNPIDTLSNDEHLSYMNGNTDSMNEMDLPMDNDLPMYNELPMYNDLPMETNEYVENFEPQNVSKTSNTVTHSGPVEVAKSIDPRVQELENSNFTSVQEISNKAIMLGVPAHVSSQIVTSVLQASSNNDERIDILRLLYIRIFTEGKFKV